MSILAKIKGNIMNLLTRPLHSYAVKIRRGTKEWNKTTLELGALIWEAHEKAQAVKGSHKSDWRRWLKEEAGISVGYAHSLIIIHAKFGDRRHEIINIGYKMLVSLSKPDVPQKAVDEIIQRARKGEKVTSKKSKKIVARHRPSPKEAAEKARESGKPVLASDGYLYFGNTKEEAEAGELRRTVVYSVREAIEILATVQWTPQEFLKQALPHQLWKPREDEQIEIALRWLQKLSEAWNRRNIDHEKLSAIENRTNGRQGIETGS